MTEYQLHTQGASHSLAPAYDGRDPMRNRPLLNGTDTSMTINRYGLGREHTNMVGSPAIVGCADGEYVRHDDHAAIISELQAELAGVERIVVAQTVTIAELRVAPVAAQEPSDEDIRDLLGEFGDHHVEDGYIAYDKWTLAEAGRVLLTRYGAPQPPTSAQPSQILSAARATVLHAVDEAGYAGSDPKSRADFVNGWRHAEAHYTVKGSADQVAQPGVPDELANVSNVLANGGGFWTSCTGCHELNEGHSTGRWSEALHCHLGLGCSECGGIGAIWDDTDYESMASDMAADMGQKVSAPTPPADGQVQRETATDFAQYLAEKGYGSFTNRELLKPCWDAAYQAGMDAQPDPAMAGDELSEADIQNLCNALEQAPLGAWAIAEKVLSLGYRKRVQPASGNGKCSVCHPYNCYGCDPCKPSNGEDARDAARYRALRDDDYQMLEDDPCVTDDSFNTFFSEDLDKAVDALIFRRDAAMRQERQP